MVLVFLGLGPAARFLVHEEGGAWRDARGYGPRASICPPAAAEAAPLDYCTLIQRSVYSLVPEGRQAASYRFLEVLCAGSIPLIYSDKPRWHWPFPSSIPEAEWLSCVAVVREPVAITKLAWEHHHGSLDAARRSAACSLVRTKVCTREQRVRLYVREVPRYSRSWVRHDELAPIKDLGGHMNSVIVNIHRLPMLTPILLTY